MQEVIIEKSQSGQRLDNYLKKYLPAAGSGFIYKMLRKKSNRISITINKASIASLRPIEVRAKLDKNGRIRYKGDKLKKLKSVKAMLNPADTKLKKLSSSAYRIMVVDPEENKVRVIGAGKNYTGYVTVTVSK